MISGFSSDLQVKTPRPEEEVYGSGGTNTDTGREIITIGDDMYGGGNDEPVIISDPIPAPQPKPDPEPKPKPKPKPDPKPTGYDTTGIDQPTMPVPNRQFIPTEMNTEQIKQFYQDNKLLVLSTGAFIGLVVLLK
jgi:hypothetical protein